MKSYEELKIFSTAELKKITSETIHRTKILVLVGLFCLLGVIVGGTLILYDYGIIGTIIALANVWGFFIYLSTRKTLADYINEKQKGESK